MMVIAFYSAIALGALAGTAILFKEAGYPSDDERKNTLLRSVRNAFGGTLFGMALLLLILYRTSPESFFGSLSVSTTVSFFCIIVVPIFLLLAIGSVIQFTVWERSRPAWRQALTRLLRTRSGDSKVEEASPSQREPPKKGRS